MTRSEFCRMTGIKNWRLIKVIQLLMVGYKYTTISEQMKVGTAIIIDIDRLFINYRPPVETLLVCRSQPYYATEQEMEIPEYNAADLRGEELEILNSIK